MKRVERLLALVLAAFSFLTISGQNGINSPYTRYGVGALSDPSIGKTTAMGGMGIAFRERNTLNTLNPASYSTVDTLTFLFDIGCSLTNGNFKENNIRINAQNASFDYLAMQFRIVRNLGFTLSLMPYSRTGYHFSSSENIRRDQDGEITATNSYAGEGSLRVVSAGLGWSPFKFLSIGADFGYMFGEFTHQISNKYNDATVLTRMKTYYADVHELKMNFGMQVSIPMLGGKTTIGAVCSPAVDFSGTGLIYDEMLDGNTSEVSDTLRQFNEFRIPLRAGAGLTYSREKWLAGVDASFDNWSDAVFFGNDWMKGRERLKISAGGSYQHDKTNHNLFLRSAYRAGVYYTTPYYKIGNNDGPKEFGVSIGASLPIINRWNNMIEVEISGQYAHIKPSAPGLIEENYLRLCLGLSFNERWFAKWQVQ